MEKYENSVAKRDIGTHRLGQYFLNNDKGHAFITIPKNASSSIKEFCETEGYDIQYNIIKSRILYTCYIRNPLERFYSGVITACHRNRGNISSDIFIKDRIIIPLRENKFSHFEEHLAPQYMFLRCFKDCDHLMFCLLENFKIEGHKPTADGEHKSPADTKKYVKDLFINEIELIKKYYKKDFIFYNKLKNGIYNRKSFLQWIV
tara:strand:+ start:351 stop:962 length:612 start_codon:yes stop_codon:yes gene_type:complete